MTKTENYRDPDKASTQKESNNKNKLSNDIMQYGML